MGLRAIWQVAVTSCVEERGGSKRQVESRTSLRLTCPGCGQKIDESAFGRHEIPGAVSP